jgi:hypothetical protein
MFCAWRMYRNDLVSHGDRVDVDVMRNDGWRGWHCEDVPEAGFVAYAVRTVNPPPQGARAVPGLIFYTNGRRTCDAVEKVLERIFVEGMRKK